jgi:hypothetical protein
VLLVFSTAGFGEILADARIADPEYVLRRFMTTQRLTDILPKFIVARP